MKKLLLTVFALLLAGTANAGIPSFKLHALETRSTC